MNITVQLKHIKEQIQNGDLENDIKAEFLKLIDNAIQNPTAESLKAIAVALQTASYAEKSLGTQIILNDESAKPAEQLFAITQMLNLTTKPS